MNYSPNSSTSKLPLNRLSSHHTPASPAFFYTPAAGPALLTFSNISPNIFRLQFYITTLIFTPRKNTKGGLLN